MNAPLARARARETVIVLGLVAVYLAAARWWMDIDLWDDSMYMGFGNVPQRAYFLRDISYGPLYASWFKVLTHLVHDPIWRYFASWGLLVTIVSIVPLLMGIRWAWAYALLLLSTPFFSIPVYISLFASIFVLAGLAIVIARKLSLPDAICVATGICFVAAFVRPEFGYAFYLSACFALPAVLFDRARNGAPATAARILAVLALCAALYYPMTRTPSSRSGIAFVQHSNLRAQEQGLLPGGNPWVSRYTQQQYHIDLQYDAGGVRSGIAAFYRANPRIFIQHLLDNLRDVRCIGLIAAICLIAGIPWVVGRYALWCPGSVYLVLVSIPVVAENILIYPRPHYGVIVIPALTLLGVQYIAQLTPVRVPPVWAALLAGITLILGTAAYHRHESTSENGGFRPNLETLTCIRAVERSSGAGSNRAMFDSITSPMDDIYFITPRTRLTLPATGKDDWQEFTDLIDREHPAWVIQGISMLHYRNPKWIAAFLQEKGYQAHPCPNLTVATIYTLPAS
jgi:hypothetical protein